MKTRANLAYIALFITFASGIAAAPTVSIDSGKGLLQVAFILAMGAACFCMLFYMNYMQKYIEPDKNLNGYFYAILSIGIILRLFLTLITEPHPTDISCFRGWSQIAANSGLSTFYTAGHFADYPPGYIYILYIIGIINKFLFSTIPAVGSLLISLPPIICDMLLGLAAFKLIKKYAGETAGFIAFLLIIFNPAIIYDSSIWQQADSVLALMMILTFCALSDEKYYWAAFLYALAVLIKPQAFIFGPVFCIAYIIMIMGSKDKKGAIIKTALCAALSLAAIFIGSLPFKGEQSLFWLADQYIETASGYQYASVNAANLFSLLGQNWTPQDQIGFIFSYSQWGWIFIGLSFVATIFFAFKSKIEINSRLFLLCAFFGISIFILSHNMHERYIMVALVFLLVAAGMLKDKRLLWCFMGFSATLLMNQILVMDGIQERILEYGVMYNSCLISISGINAALYAYFAYACFMAFKCKSEAKSHDEIKSFNKKNKKSKILLNSKYKLAWSKLDTKLMLGLTLIYAAIAFINLGTNEAPETLCEFGGETSIEIDLGEPTEVSEIWTYSEVSNTKVKVFGKTDDRLYDAGVLDINHVNLFTFKEHKFNMLVEKIVLVSPDDMASIFELTILDKQGNMITPQSVISSDGLAQCDKLFDEQHLIPEKRSYYNSMYFDEIYHARAAYEQLNDMPINENTHPPLSKSILSVGIMIFGMNPFGWRFIGTLFGVLMVPLMYLMAKRLTRNSIYSFFAAFLMSFDFMHFVQTRISTIDSYAIFFTMLMFYFMIWYYQCNFYTDGLKKSFIPLGLAGIAFGVGAACKWTCIYSGGGLAILFFITLFKRYMEYREASKAEEKTKTSKLIKDNFVKYTIYTLLFCILMYIIVPIAIYLLSYIPYGEALGDKPILEIWNKQEFMFEFHSQLTETHPFESKWYTWLLDIRPIWYYQAPMAAEGMIGSIASFGNIFIWGMGLISIIWIIADKARGDKSPEKTIVLIGYFIHLLPWVFITRAVFIYHYFSCVPFLILAFAIKLMDIENHYANKRKLHSDMINKKRIASMAKYVIIGVVAVMFIAYYPILAGIEIPVWYAKALKWLPSWDYFIA